LDRLNITDIYYVKGSSLFDVYVNMSHDEVLNVAILDVQKYKEGLI